MVELAQLHRRAAERFTAAVDAIGSDQWAAPTPCTEWDVRALLAHNVEENLWVPAMLAGETIASVGDRFEGDTLGDDPKTAWKTSVEEACAAVDAPGALAGRVHLSYGEESATEYVRQRLIDLVVHGWDLARAVGADESLPGDLVEACLEWAEPLAPMLAQMPGLFAPAVKPALGAGAQTRLLNLLGRQE